MKKLFVSLMAVAALVSCSKEEETNAPAIDSNKKSVQITIANGNGGTRAAGDGVSAGITAGNSGETATTCEASELSILFANDGGTILKVMPLVANTNDQKDHVAGTAEYVPGKAAEAGTYLWHNVPAAVTQVAVVRCKASDITITPGTTTLDKVEELAVDEELNLQRPISEVVLYDEDTLGEKGELCTDVDGTKFYVYPASLRVAPKFARIEITQIQCKDLGAKNVDGNPSTVSLDWIEVESLTWNSNKNNGYKIDATTVGTMYGEYVPAAEPAKPATDKIIYANESDKGATVWSWNIMPADFKDMLLTCEVGAYDYTVASSAAELYIKGLAKNVGATTPDANGFAAENIYRIALDFTEADLSGQEGLCVQVEVEIVNWTVNTVHPVFGDR